MATEEYSVGYDAGYQDGWNEAMDAQTKPPQRTLVNATTWRGLTDDDMGQWIEEEHDVLRWAEAKLKEKNSA